MNSETARQYRVTRQMVDMHARLRDDYHRKALVIDLIILAGSVVFAVTTFATDQTFRELSISPAVAVNVLRGVSVALFFASVAALRVDWKGLEGRHDEAVRRLAKLVTSYREERDDTGLWPGAVASDLSRQFSETTTSIIPIPPRRFGSLKARYLRAKEVSKILDSRPGYPYVLAHIVVRLRAIRESPASPPSG